MFSDIDLWFSRLSHSPTIIICYLLASCVLGVVAIWLIAKARRFQNQHAALTAALLKLDDQHD